MPKRSRCLKWPLLPVLCCLFCLCGCAQAFEWSATDVQLLYGEGFNLGDSERATATFEHADGWRYGDNFLFVDLIHHLGHGGAEIEAYGEWYTRFSLKKMFGWEPGLPGIRDVLPSFGFNAGSRPTARPFRAYLAGLGFDFDLPGFDYLQLGLFAYQAETVSATGVQVTPVWSVPFSLGGLRFKFRGFLDYSTGGTNAFGSWHLLTQPQLLLDVGALCGGAPDTFMAGVEWWIWLNKYGIKGQNESAPQAALVYFF
jgi:nucleoside-specific outer membrane channel protein Tsx